jgi:YVTN family beta-propeller protein
MKNSVSIIILCSLLISCTKLTDLPPSDFKMGGGVLIVDEGNFRSGNGELSFFSYDSTKVFNDLFYKTNSRPLGDVPNSLCLTGDKVYVVVNNSGKIEIIDQTTLTSKKTITGLISPRNMTIVDDTKAYVSSLYSDSVTILDLESNSVSGYINLKRTSEAIAIAGKKAFVSNWAGGNEVMVISTTSDRVIDSITVGIEPESMVVDRLGRLWVLCNGGWARQNFAELYIIDIFTDKVEKKFVFPSKEASPTCLRIDGLGQTLYYLDHGVKLMDITQGYLPSEPIVPESGATFYKLAINPVNSDILITDVADYTQPGNLYIYKNTGAYVFKGKTGIIPGEMCFKLKI